MSDVDWRQLLTDFLERRIDERTFHDRFFEHWHRLSAADWAVVPPTPIETLFFVVEAYCPDPTLRDLHSRWEAGDRQLREAAGQALSSLDRNSKI